MAPTSESKDNDKDKGNDNDNDNDNGKDKDSPSPPSSPKSSPPLSTPSSQSPPSPHCPPPSDTSSPSSEKSSPPPPPKTPPQSPPPSPDFSPPPTSSESKEAPSMPKDSPSPPSPTSKGSNPTPDYSPPTKQDSHSPKIPSTKSPPHRDSPKGEDSPSPSPPPPSSQYENQNQTTSSPQPTENSASSSSSSSIPNLSFTPSSPSGSPESSWQLPKSAMISNSPNSLNSMDYTISRSNTSQNQATRLGIAFGVVAAVIIIGIVTSILFLYKRRKDNRYNNLMYMMPAAFGSSPDFGSSMTKPSPHNGGDCIHSSPDTGGIGSAKTWFGYEELASATDGFDSTNILGTGGFGCVYKGFLQDGTTVAIKKLKANSGQGDREFRAEVEIISRIHHRHLVSLVGYCLHDDQRLLVYDYVPNDTLYYHLHAQNKAPMDWVLRVRVACGSARGIAYLHEDCHPRIIHRDIKSANILLSNNFEAKVADFGLAKLAQELESNTHVSTRVVGTFGYMAPEYATSGKLTEKSDVFSFGVVLLEMITGRKPVDDTRPLGDESLVEWARPLMSEVLESQNFDEIADPRLEGNYDRAEMFRTIEAAAACVRNSASKRPRMSQVVRALDTMGDLSNGVRPGESEIIDSREQSVQIKMFKRMTFESQDYSSDANFSQSSWTSESSSEDAKRWKGQT